MFICRIKNIITLVMLVVDVTMPNGVYGISEAGYNVGGDAAVCTFTLYSRSKYSKTCLKRPLNNRQNKGLKTNGSLMKVESIAECSLGAFCNTFDLH